MIWSAQRQTAKSERLLPDASASDSHFGLKPRPDQELPVAGSRYFAATFLPVVLASPLLPAGALARSVTVKPCCAISA